jgi:hypothetical protein
MRGVLSVLLVAACGSPMDAGPRAPESAEECKERGESLAERQSCPRTPIISEWSRDVERCPRLMADAGDRSCIQGHIEEIRGSTTKGERKRGLPAAEAPQRQQKTFLHRHLLLG